MYEHRVKKFYKTAGKCDDQQHYKAILEAVMVSTPDKFTDNGSMSFVSYMPVKQLNTRKSLHRFSEILDAKPNTYVRMLCAGK